MPASRSLYGCRQILSRPVDGLSGTGGGRNGQQLDRDVRDLLEPRRRSRTARRVVSDLSRVSLVLPAAGIRSV